MVAKKGDMEVNKLTLCLQALGMEYTDTINVHVEGLTRIDLEAFIQIVCLCIEQQPTWGVQEAGEVFNLFDRDGGGTLDRLELKRVLTKIGETINDTEIADQVAEFDVNGDKQMHLAEFCQLIKTTRGSDYLFEDA
jgi:Ca2+-binding EF-hand superfamily protein